MIPLKKRNPWLKRLLIAALLLIIAGGGIFWYVQNKKFRDTKNVKADFNTEASALLKEFETSPDSANARYTDKILTVTGTVTETEAADSTMNLKITDTTSGSYIIFAFQQQHVNEASQVHAGDRVTIKGACTGGIFSRLRKATAVTFQRCTLIKE